ncbi:hypothetical protein Lalb_Chr11g0070401 [Lupinus albus]|uniref:Uncharacterized protein n=1 Tax=Lupinus albus TaxID=3870 RepID=A0A6A4PS52_LUPAL|nr:hypothetical protein Lalb_Chr11g0070401 [Lupinus albus]
MEHSMRYSTVLSVVKHEFQMGILRGLNVTTTQFYNSNKKGGPMHEVSYLVKFEVDICSLILANGEIVFRI